MVQALDPGQPVYGLQSPHRLDGPWSVEELARHYLLAIRCVQSKGPFRLAGWSFGAPVAFEIARQFRALNEEVEFLGLMDAAVADLSSIPSIFRPLLLPISLAFLVGLIAVTTLPRSYSNLRRLAQAAGISLPASPRGFFRGFSSTSKVFNVIFSDIRRSLRLALLNTRAGLRYSPRIYDGDAVLFLASSSTFPHTARELAKFMPGGFHRRKTPGNHMSMMLDPVQAATLGRSLQQCLRRTDALGGV
jgi:pimeloyl-ACP methyl ester carboxylesterase